MRPREMSLRLTFAVTVMMAFGGVAVHGQQSSLPQTGEQEFLASIQKGNAARVSELLKQNPSLIKATTKGGTTAVLVAVLTGHDEIAELLATGMELNIFEAAATARLDRVRALLDKNPELAKAYSPDGWTALHLSVEKVDLLKLLIDRGADINAVSKNRFAATLLQGAAKFNAIDSARLLIERGANVNLRGEGRAPLHEAAGNGEIEFARLLIDHGAEINAKDSNGKTPLTIALENKQTEMATFLRGRNGSQ